ncbi:phosphoglucosamine mutase, partial [Tsukamurella tyrosinosolvens]
MGRLFGTDGVRGLANKDLTADLALKLSAAAAAVLGAHDLEGRDRPFAVVGWDPRASSEMLSAAVSAGLTSAGVDVLLVGVMPTPAVAHLVAEYDAALG